MDQADKKETFRTGIIGSLCEATNIIDVNGAGNNKLKNLQTK